MFILSFWGAARAQINVNDARATADYWIERMNLPQEVLLYPDEISALNAGMRQKNVWLTDLAAYPLTVTGEYVQSKIFAVTDRSEIEPGDVPEGRDDGRILTADGYRRAMANRNIDAVPQESIAVRFAVAKRRADLRLLPSNLADDFHYDSLQATVLDPLEAAAVLHDSADGQYCLVETANYAGWLKSADLVFVARDEWREFVAPQKFLTVTANRKTLAVDGEEVLFQMGARLPLVGKNRVRLPGGRTLVVNDSSGLNVGYLPFTRENIFRQSFKFLGDEYGWGGLDSSVDCSAFVMDVYKSMGIMLPRDSDWQEIATEAAGKVSGDRTARLNAVKGSPSGSLLFKPGHVMMYLGTDDEGEPLVIHAASSYFDFSSGYGKKIYIRQVLVSDLHYKNGRGIETIDCLTGIGKFVAGH